ncbi:DUF2946 family protein [Derxia lacustris]|uniref:DUF2946 family protein n=1 Tax=Derxia lacustris TaxID=764842 RepID=UPI000A1711AE|nr:DUF2946 family protein [Derxia lacustris]
MDADVIAAMAHWPDVPACYGWLALDRRGRWRMRDDACQRLGLPGELIGNATLRGFIDRNYLRDAAGAWFFQNGPQRVYVLLEAAPLVLFAHPGDAGPRLVTHNGLAVSRLDRAAFDDAGRLWLVTEHGPGIVDDRDLAALVDCLVDADGSAPDPDRLAERCAAAPTGLRLRLAGAELPLEIVAAADAGASFGFIADPSPADPA